MGLKCQLQFTALLFQSCVISGSPVLKFTFELAIVEWQFVDVAVAAEEDKMSNTSFADSTDDLHMRTAGIVVDVLDMETVVVLHFAQPRETLLLHKEKDKSKANDGANRADKYRQLKKV
uniref:Uncharacterized protein n=1 Tax=Glossina pallidipes TaxID=7398 RepID=A0A1A9Z279_GLOPL